MVRPAAENAAPITDPIKRHTRHSRKYWEQKKLRVTGLRQGHRSRGDGEADPPTIGFFEPPRGPDDTDIEIMDTPIFQRACPGIPVKPFPRWASNSHANSASAVQLAAVVFGRFSPRKGWRDAARLTSTTTHQR